MSKKRIFITGASGCIGHYVAEKLIQDTEHELFFLVRNPDKLQFEYQNRPNVHILQGDLQNIEKFGDLLFTMDVAVLMATAWGASETYQVNLNTTMTLISLLNPEKIEQVFYFSTASILGRNNQLLQEADDYGTTYIRSKYQCYRALEKSAIASKITVLFPTLVVGGDTDKPYSHITGGLPEVAKQVNLIRWLKTDASCHFIHAQDIAQVVYYFVDHPPNEESTYERDESGITKIVIGNPETSLSEALEEIGTYFGKKTYFRIPLTLWLANIFIVIFRIQVQDWDRFCLDYRHFTYDNPVNPSTLNLQHYYPTLTHMLKTYVPIAE